MQNEHILTLYYILLTNISSIFQLWLQMENCVSTKATLTKGHRYTTKKTMRIRQ